MKFMTVAVLSATSLLASTLPARADDTPWAFRLGAAHVGFSTHADVTAGGNPVPGGDASASDNTTLGFELSYEHNSHLTTRFLAGIPPETTLSGRGTLASANALGKATYAPAVLSVTWKLLDSGPVQPYLGVGVNYTWVIRSSDAFITNLKVDSAFGSVLEAGVEVPLQNGWFLSLDARKIYLKTKANGNLPAFGGIAAHADVTLDPLVVLAAAGWHF